VLAADVSLGMVMALGTLLVAMLGVPPARRSRPRLALVGVAFAVAYGAGAVLALCAPAAVAGLAAAAYAGVLLAARTRAAGLVPALLLPALALGMNHPAPDGFVAAAVLLAGSTWATVVTCAWPEARPPAVPTRTPGSSVTPRGARTYAILFAAAAGIALALGHLLDLTHVAWAAEARSSSCDPTPGCSRAAPPAASSRHSPA
jgi:hypothetical protein